MPVCIAGMHRSGTSMVARLLNLCGLSLGDGKDMIDPAEDNPDGYWEHKRFLRINEQILERFQGGWDLPPVFPEHWERLSELDDLRREARNLIQEFKGVTHWGWKDPRSSLTLPFWKSLIPDLKVLVVVRNPLDVHASLQKRGRSSQTFALDLWLKYARSIKAATGDVGSIVTHYASFFSDPAQEIERIAAFCGLEPTAEELDSARETILIGKHKRDAGLLDLLALDASNEVKATYWQLCQEAGPVYEALLQQEMLSAGPTAQVILKEMTAAGSGRSAGRAQDRVDVQTPGEAHADPRHTLYEATIAQQQARIASLLLWHEKDQAEIAGWKRRYQELAAHLQAVQSGKAWAIVSRLRRLRVLMAPPGSLPARIGSKLVAGVRKWRREGFGGVVRAVARRTLKPAGRTGVKRGTPAQKVAPPPDESSPRDSSLVVNSPRPAAKEGVRGRGIAAAGPADVSVTGDPDGYEETSAAPALLRRLEATGETRPFVVVVSHTCFLSNVGGIETLLQQEMAAFRARGIAYVHLAPLSGPAAGKRGNEDLLIVSVDDETIGEIPAPAVFAALEQGGAGKAGCRGVMVHHTMYWRPATLDRLLETLGACPRFFWIHDYYSICRNFNLLRNDTAYCGGPEPSSNACMICRYGVGREAHLKVFEALFEKFDFTFVTPSEAAKEVWSGTYPSLAPRAIVAPLYSLREAQMLNPRLLTADGPIKIAFAGASTVHKGWHHWRQIVHALQDRGIEFYHLGSKAHKEEAYPESEQFFRVSNLENRDAMRQTFIDLEIDVVVSCSICPETFSIVTLEAHAAGCWIVTTEASGNVARYVRKNGCGKVFVDVDQVIAYLGDAALLPTDLRSYRATMDRLQELTYNDCIVSEIYLAGERAPVLAHE